MNKNPNQPREFDAVKGGQAPPPVDGVVLGGLEGVKHRLKSTVARERAATLIEALRFGAGDIPLVGLIVLIRYLQVNCSQAYIIWGYRVLKALMSL